MANTANIQCVMCRSMHITRKWVNTNSYLQCDKCGERF